MWFSLRPVEIDFLETAPRVYTVEADTALPRKSVWEALTDPWSWPEWWPGVRSASYRGEPPYGIGTVRVADVGGWLMEETMLAWDEQRRWAYRIDRSTAPLAKAQLESTELADFAGGTRVRWTLATHPGIVLTLGAPFFERSVQRMLERALANLERRASARG